MPANRALILLIALFSAQVAPLAVAQSSLIKSAEGSLNKSAEGSLSKSAKDSPFESYNLGGVNRCAKIPIFFDDLQMSEQTVIDTTITHLPGVVLRELDEQRRLYQKPSWRTAGNVGSIVRDSIGNTYVIPVPSVSLEGNPLERRNIVYKINSRTGLMNEYVRLPLPEASSQENPFGTVALDLDCETNSLYVSSVAGSTASQINGVIYRIDLNTGKITDKYSGFDAIGLGIFNMPNEKRLYLGDARSSSLYSIVLGKDGRFIKGQAPKYETSLLSIKNGDSTQIKKIRFTQDPHNTQIMTLSDTDFAYRMQAQSNRRFRHYEFVLDINGLYWTFRKITY